MPLQPASPNNYRPDIDGLRAIAILAVVIFHAFPEAARGGFVGVDVFFVISGFLISRIVFRGMVEGNFSFGSFYAHRIKRIFPALVLVLLASYAFGWFTLLPQEYELLGKHIAAGAGFVQNIVLWREVGYFDVASELKPLLHLWSLAIEEQFYLVYPLLIWFAWRAGTRVHVFAMVVLLGILSFGLNVARIGAHPTEVFFLSHTRFWELLAGGVLAYLSLFHPESVGRALRRLVFRRALGSYLPPVDRQEAHINNALAAVGLGLITAAVFGLNKADPFPGWRALLPVAGSWLLIFAGTQTWINRHILANRWMVFIGLISFPLYLWHWPLLSFLRLVEQSPSLAQRSAAVAAAFVLAWLTYRFVERPVRFGGHGKAKVYVLTCSLAATAWLGWNAFEHRGLALRFPAEIRAVASYDYDPKSDMPTQKCWLSKDDSPAAFSPECLGSLKAPGSSGVLVWGDSHAARLYPGIQKHVGNRDRVALFTRDACAPVLGLGYENCIAGNRFVLSTIGKYLPQTVVLFAVWNSHAERWGKDTAGGVALLNTIRELKVLGVENVIVIGPAPRWSENLPKLALKAWNESSRQRIPVRMSQGLEPSVSIADADLRQLFKQEHSARYFSVLDALCNADGCLVRTSESPTSFTTWDYGHFTTDGAVYVARQLPIPARAAPAR